MDATRFATQPALPPVVKGLAFLLTPAFGILLRLSLCSGVRAADKLTIQVDPGTTFQTIDGFGASDAWRCQFVGKNWPLEKRERIADLLFSRETDDQGNPRGIGLSIWRFYLSAGTAEQGGDSDIGNPWRRGECFLNSDGDYDWTKLAGQQWFLRAARDRGVERLLAFPNAPPVHLSKNGKGYATRGDIDLNVKPGCLDDYANYLSQEEALCDLGSDRKARLYTTSEASSLRKGERPARRITIPARSVATVCLDIP